jgi:hypothetical protein
MYPICNLKAYGVLTCISFLFIFLASIALARVDTSTSRKGCNLVEKMLLRDLGFSEDANDSEIVALLDVRGKRILATSLIERRKIVSAVPKLSAFVEDKTLTLYERINAAETLCTLGNNTWLPIIKEIAEDPNSAKSLDSLKYNVAGLLARAGDFSQFNIIEKGFSDENKDIRWMAMLELSKFAHSTDPVTDKAANLLTDMAKGDPDNKFREFAIEGLENLAKAKPALKEKVIEALEANVNSTDKNLQAIYKAKLSAYKKPAEPNK